MKNIRIIVPVMLGLIVCLLIIGCGSNATGGGGGGGSSSPSLVYIATTGHDDTGEGTVDNPYRTIQKGLDVVAANGIVSVDAGVYTENLTWPSKEGISLYGGVDGSVATLDGGYAGRCINFPWDTSIKNAGIGYLDIINGYIYSDNGAGINMVCPNTQLYLYCVNIHNCTLEAGGAAVGCGISAYDSTSTLEAISCTFNNNIEIGSGPYAAGVFCGGTLYLSSCEVSYNTAKSGAGGIQASLGRIENCLIHHNNGGSEHGGGIALYGDTPGVQVINCTITTNETSAKGGGVFSYHCADRLINCIIWNDYAAAGSNEVYWWPSNISGMTGTVEYCDVQGGSIIGVNNVDVDPQFNDNQTDFHLSAGEPLVYAGGTTEAAPSCDLDGITRDDPYSMGAYEKNNVIM